MQAIDSGNQGGSERRCIVEIPVIAQTNFESLAATNRSLMQRRGVFALNIMGNPGWGKTSLIAETVARIVPFLHVGVVYSIPDLPRDGQRLAGLSDQSVQVDAGNQPLTAHHLHRALVQLDLDQLNILLIENISSLAGAIDQDLGEDVKVVIFSAAAGDDKVGKYAHAVAGADAVILSKIDLLPSLGFNVDWFRADVRRLNPSARIFEVSVANGSGLDEWIEWLNQQALLQGRLNRTGHPS